MNRLTIQIHLNNPPRCPICQSDLIPAAIRFFMGVAICHHCYTTPTCTPALARLMQFHNDAPELFSESDGLVIYNPPPHTPRMCAAALMRNNGSLHRPPLAR
jgi:hypothetical protein